MPTLGVFGGSFDPPHVAHVMAAAYALSAGAFDRLLVVPVFAHAFDKRLESFEHRVKLCELACEDRGAAMGLAGRARADAEFSIEHMADRYRQLYRELLGIGTEGGGEARS